MKKNEFLHKVLLKLDQRQHYFLSSILAVGILYHILVFPINPLHHYPLKMDFNRKCFLFFSQTNRCARTHL